MGTIWEECPQEDATASRRGCWDLRGSECRVLLPGFSMCSGVTPSCPSCLGEPTPSPRVSPPSGRQPRVYGGVSTLRLQHSVLGRPRPQAVDPECWGAIASRSPCAVQVPPPSGNSGSCSPRESHCSGAGPCRELCVAHTVVRGVDTSQVVERIKRCGWSLV